MFRRFKKHIIEGFIGVGRHFAMSFSTSIAVMVTLILISIFLIVTTNLQNITKDIEGSIKIVALVEKNKENLISNIQTEITKLEHVINVEHRTKDQEYQYYIKTFAEGNEDLFKAYASQNPFHEAFIIEINDANKLEEITNQVVAIDGIYEASYGGLASIMLVDVLSSIRFGGIILVCALCLLAIYLVYNTIKITIYARADEIWIMRNVGAKNGYIRAPFLVEGIIIGLMGAIIPILLTTFGYIYLYYKLDGNFLSPIFHLLEPHPYILYIDGILILAGMIVGFIGSYISVCKFLRIRR